MTTRGNQLSGEITQSNIVKNKSVRNGFSATSIDGGKTADTMDETEKNLLIALGKNMVAIRSRPALNLFIENTLKEVFSFDDMVVMLVDGQKASLMAVFKYFEYDRFVRPEYRYLLTGGSCTVNDGIGNITIAEQNTVLWHLPDVMQWKSIPPYVEVFVENGMKTLISIPVYVAEEAWGILYFYAKEEDAFTTVNRDLFFNVIQQLGLVILNILTNEEIQKRDAEKEFLLSLGNSLVSIRHKKELTLLLKEKFKELPFFSEAIIFCLDTENQTHSPLAIDDMVGQDYNFENIGCTAGGISFPVKDGFFDRLLEQSGVTEYNIATLLQEEIIPVYVQEWARNGVIKIVAAPIYNGAVIAGMLFFFSKEPDFFFERYLDLIGSIAYQLSGVAANLYVVGEIVYRENEKEILLAISNDMSTIRSKDDLLRVLHERLRKIIYFSHAVTGLTDSDTGTYTGFILDPNSICLSHPHYQEIVSKIYSVHDPIMRLTLDAKAPVVLDLDDFVNIPELPLWIRMNYESGMREVVMTRLEAGDKHLGTFCILSDRKGLFQSSQLNIIQGISSQLSNAVANILANEKIETQITQITQYKQQLEFENLYLQEEINTTYNYSEIVGQSRAMQEVFQLVSQVAESQSSVLILGETGTGKELIARAIHNSSLRKNKLMVKVNCATLPANLIESELFGHERGSFTGATEKRIGKFELANNSTLFLDEVGELPLDLQVKLLRALQEKEIERVGGRTVIKTDVRIIAATNRDLKKEVAAGNFRSDLYFRLDVFPITLPSLRDRKEDIPYLASHFLVKHARNNAGVPINISNTALKQLMAYCWPGNVRELEHMIERSILLCNSNTINRVNLPNDPVNDNEELSDIRFKTLEENERIYILEVLKSCKGKIAGIGGAAEILDLPISTLNSRIRKLGIKKHYFKD